MQKIIESLFEIGALKMGSFTLKSGQSSPIYVDLRLIISRPKLLRSMSEQIWKHQTSNPDLICGVPYTALPIATCISLDHNLPMLIRRKETKDYGTKQKIEGIYSNNDRVIIIEDVVTTGTSILETARDLENVGLQVVEVLAFLDREQGGRETLENAGYAFHAAVTLTEIATHLHTMQLIDKATKEAILAARKATI